jgi:hypothetical protein
MEIVRAQLIAERLHADDSEELRALRLLHRTMIRARTASTSRTWA